MEGAQYRKLDWDRDGAGEPQQARGVGTVDPGAVGAGLQGAGGDLNPGWRGATWDLRGKAHWAEDFGRAKGLGQEQVLWVLSSKEAAVE